MINQKIATVDRLGADPHTIGTSYHKLPARRDESQRVTRRHTSSTSADDISSNSHAAELLAGLSRGRRCTLASGWQVP